MRSWTGPSGRRGRCLVCGEPLATEPTYWVTAHPDGVHDGCRAWETEPFPFDGDLDRLRILTRALDRMRAIIVQHGQWLVRVKAAWASTRREPTDPTKEHPTERAWAREWAERKRSVQHRLAVLKDRLEL